MKVYLSIEDEVIYVDSPDCDGAVVKSAHGLFTRDEWIAAINNAFDLLEIENAPTLYASAIHTIVQAQDPAPPREGHTELEQQLKETDAGC